jgi:heme exporter protein B
LLGEPFSLGGSISSGGAVLHDAGLVAGKDLRIEWRSRVTANQVAPFALLLLLLFAFALDPDRGILARVTSGLFWVAVLFSGLLAIQRSFAIEAADGNRDALRLSGLRPAGVFLGKVAAIAVQLVALEIVLTLGVAVLYDTQLTGALVLLVSSLLATVGIAAAGTVYGALAAGLRVRDTLLPLLLLPVLGPVLIAATESWEAALGGASSDAWGWCNLLLVFAAVYAVFGALSFATLLEES